MSNKPSYSTNDPKGWGGDPSRGAALGRPTVSGPTDYSGEVCLERVHLDLGGYDKNGTYFGVDAPLYWYASEDGEVDGMLRASDFDTARCEVLEMYPDAIVTESGLSDFETQYLATALWSSTDDDGEFEDSHLDANYSIQDIAPETLETVKADCRKFRKENAVLLAGIDSGQAGHDFWLTRNGHGAGFWDRGLGDVGDKLTDACKEYRELHSFAQDGKVYFE